MIEGVNIGHALIAGFFAAFLMALAGYWLEGLFGLPRIDLALVYAGAVFLNLEDIFDKPIEWWWGPPAGMIYALAVFLIVPVGLMGSITALSGGQPNRDPKMLATGLIQHLLWGAALGALYFPVR